MTLTEANVANLRAKKLIAKPELSVPRRLSVLRPGEGKAAAPPLPGVTDDFYELNEDDLRAITLAAGLGGGGGSAGGGGNGNAPAMQTAAMRELSKLKAIKEYSHARVRVRLPGGLLVEASYHPQEPVAHVLDVVSSCLIEPLASAPNAYLFTTPPRTELSPSSSLVEAGLVPAATAVLAWKGTPPPQATATASNAESNLREHAKELLAAASAASAGEAADGESFPTVLGAKPAATPAAAAGAAGSGAAAASSSGAASGEGGEEKKSRPKWLKM